MKAKEFDIKKRDPNWRAMQDIRRSGAGGQHKDKKRAAKQGEVKHKGKDMTEGYTTEKQIMTRIRQIMHDRKLSGTNSNAGELHRLKQQLKDMRSQQDVAEGDYPDGSSIKTPDIDEWKQQYQQAVMAVKNAKTQQEYEAASDRAGRIKDLLASKGIKVDSVLGQQDVAEGSDWGEPREILEDVLRTLEREVEWPLTEVMDPKQVRQLLSPIVRAVNDKLLSMDENTDIPFSKCPECRGPIFHESLIDEKQDACYHKVKSRYKVWPSAYASGALVQCRKKGAKNWGNKSK